MSGAVIEAGFDYAVIDADGRDDVMRAADRIRLRMSRTVEDIIEIGRDLIAVKAALAHGQFERWIEAEFGMALRTARNFMQVADRFALKSATVADLPAAVLYALAAPSTDEAVIEEVVERAASGETITRDDVAALKAEKKELRRQLDEAKLAAREAKSSQQDFGNQLVELRHEMAGLRDERDTLSHDLERSRRGVVGNTKVVDVVDDSEAIERQIAAVLNAWNKAGPEARAAVRNVIDAPVFDKSRAA